LEELENDAEEHEDRVNAMREHLRNVEAEVTNTQSRAEARRKEKETEAHMKRLSEMAMARVRDDARKMEKEELELAERVANIEQASHRGVEKLDAYKLQLNWGQEELEQWAAASARKDEDALALEKYKRADDARVRELNLAIERATKTVAEKKSALESEVSETQAAQLELDRAAEDFRNLHAERQDVVRQWEDVIESMKRRDAAIADASRDFAKRRKETRLKRLVLAERTRFLEQELTNNKETDVAIETADRGMANIRERYETESAEQRALADETDAAKNALRRAAAELATLDGGNSAKREALLLKRQKLEKTQNKLEKATKRLEREKLELMSLEERGAELDRVQKENEEELTAARKDAAAHKDLLMRARAELKGLGERTKALDAETQGARTQNKGLARKIALMDERVLKQQETLYHAEFQIQNLERRVARAGGARSDEETRVLQAKIDALQSTLRERVAEHDALVASTRRAEEDLEAARKRSKQLKRATSALSGEISELTLEAEYAAKDVRAAVSAKEDKMVAHDTLKLEVKKLRDLLDKKADQVFDLENRKAQLQLSMEERRHEVETHAELLRAQHKMLREDVHRATLEMRERSMKVGKLQTKFEVLVNKVKRHGMDGDENGGEHSQAYYVVKAAQEREEMQRRGDELDASIRKSEKEVVALEATLRQLTAQNDSFRVANRPVDERDGDALATRAALREKLETAKEKLRFHREEESRAEEELRRRDEKVRRLHEEAGEINEELDVLEREAAESEAKLRDTARRAEETHKELMAAQDAYRAAKGLPPDGDQVGPEELDMRCEELREGTRVVVSELKAVAAEHPELATLLASYGVKLPGVETQ
jgi:coiled-coil domain-containing protein 39